MVAHQLKVSECGFPFNIDLRILKKFVLNSKSITVLQIKGNFPGRVGFVLYEMLQKGTLMDYVKTIFGRAYINTHIVNKYVDNLEQAIGHEPPHRSTKYDEINLTLILKEVYAMLKELKIHPSQQHRLYLSIQPMVNFFLCM